MTRESFPEIPVEALRSQVHPASVERVWRRLRLDVTRPRRSIRASYWWAPAGALVIFGVGVWVGSRLSSSSVEVAAVAEPRPPLPAAGPGPVRERQPPATERKATPAPKRTPQVHVHSSEAEAATGYPESYGDPVIASASEPTPLPTGPAEWEKLAEAGDFLGARGSLEREGGFGSASARASASQLMVLADIARASGEREQALQALRRVLLAYEGAPEAPIAAWTLGNLLEQSGDQLGAADAYATYRRLSPTGDFAEDAAARQVDVAISQGNQELAARAMEEYARNFPKGRRAAELRKRVAALASPADAASDEGSGVEESDDEPSEPEAEAPSAPPAPLREH